MTITAGRTVDSSTVKAFTRIVGLNPTTDGGRYAAAAASMSQVLAAADPKRAGVVDGVGANGWSVDGDRLRSPDTTAQLDALGAVLSDDVRLEDLSLDATTSEITLSVKGADQIAATCQRGLTALEDFPGLRLTVARWSSPARDAQLC